MRHSGQIDNRLRKIELTRPRNGIRATAQCEGVVRWLADVLELFPPDLALSREVVWRRRSEAGDLIPDALCRNNQKNLHALPGDHLRPYRVPLDAVRLEQIRAVCRQIVADVRTGDMSDLTSFLAAIPPECREAIYFLLGRLVRRW